MVSKYKTYSLRILLSAFLSSVPLYVSLVLPCPHYSAALVLRTATLISGRRPITTSNDILKLPVEWKLHLSASTPLLLSCSFHFLIPLPTFSKQEMCAAKNNYVPVVYPLRKNGFMCLKNGEATTREVIKLHFHKLFPTIKNSIAVWSRDAAPLRTITPFHRKSPVTLLASMWKYVGQNSNVRRTKGARTGQKRLPKYLESCLHNGDMATLKVNCYYVFKSFLTKGCVPVNYRTNGVP